MKIFPFDEAKRVGVVPPTLLNWSPCPFCGSTVEDGGLELLISESGNEPLFSMNNMRYGAKFPFYRLVCYNCYTTMEDKHLERMNEFWNRNMRPVEKSEESTHTKMEMLIPGKGKNDTKKT